ncbi:MAG: glycosyltransferase family 39 protein [Candidatus Omnitrophica bacterium]|nr:glycosyltransferase family 39 protein [Candidatus Omnitrophota bacterium]
MSILIPLILSSLTGYLIIITLFREKTIINKTLTLVLSAGLGIGLNSVLTFYSFFIMNGFNRKAIWTFSSVIPFILILINHKTILYKMKNCSFKINFLSPVVWTLWGVLFYIILFMAKAHPFGQWDAWALYNMKMKFLLFGADHWKDIFEKLHWYTQPDYPLLLPFINVYHFALSQTPQQTVPLITGVVFTMLIGWVIFGGLKQIMSSSVAFFASLLLLSNPFFIFQSTGQYADTILAYYLLASILCIQLTLLYSNKPLAFLSGLMLGLMTFVKNEGIVIAIILISIFIVYLVFKSVPKEEKNKWLLLIPFLMTGFLITASPTLILKLFLAPTNKDIFGLSVIHMKFLNWDGFMILVHAFITEISQKRWTFIWFFIIFLFLVANKKLFYKECKIVILFLILYSFVLTIIYLTTVNFDLSWRIKSTLPRICYYLLPSLLYYAYYAVFRMKKDKAQDS